MQVAVPADTGWALHSVTPLRVNVTVPATVDG